jgi:septal ring factor EnvC (AmiA/AmiB activator)
MQQQVQQLETEISRLQVELRQVRQMIGSLVRHEQETTRLMAQQMNQGNNAFPQQIYFDQQQEQNQLRHLQGLADTMYHQLSQAVPTFHLNQHQPQKGHGMNPAHNDPMQRQF